VTNLQQRGSAKPRTLKTLSGTINLLLQKSLTDEESTSLLESPQRKGIISVTGAKVSRMPCWRSDPGLPIDSAANGAQVRLSVQRRD
jgi:hypothetical protein